jgi:hypothetical protein
MLVVLVLTAAVSGFLRDCFGHNGHRAIEWTHVAKTNHWQQRIWTFQEASVVVEAIGTSGPDCVDRLIFSETVCPPSSAATLKAPRLRYVSFADPGSEPCWCARFPERHFLSYVFKSAAVPDPALAVLRTTVMLN